MFFYKMEHRGGFKEAVETAVALSDLEFLGLLRRYDFYCVDDRLGVNGVRFMYKDGPEGAYYAGFTTWLIMCPSPKSAWRF